jgi:NADPH:quinone reductase-like Zn-dependent oxidoreductase
MKYRSILVVRNGGPEVMQVVENELRAPRKGEVRIKVLASAVSRPDVNARQGTALYSGTPLGRKTPFVPGYAVIGDVDAVGEDVHETRVGDRVGVLSVVGGYSEYLYWKSSRLIPIPGAIDAVEAVPLILNYIVAYQVMHRSAKVKEGDKALIIGASGGIGSALLQLGQLAKLDMVGLASPDKSDILLEYGAKPVDYHCPDVWQELRKVAREGYDVIFDGVMSREYVQHGLSLLAPGGRMVSFGEPARSEFGWILLRSLGEAIFQRNRKYKFYGTSTYFLFDPKPYLEDWAVLFLLLTEHKIKPVITARFPILEAARANMLMESGQVIGNIVLARPELLREPQ